MARFSPATRILLLCAVLSSARLLWPGDTAFIHDEAMLLETARAQNAAGQWTTHGLLGSRGVVYGPFPTLFYRALFAVTDSVWCIGLMKAAVVSAGTWAALAGWWRLFPAFAPAYALVPLLSLYLWIYARDLWDNSLLVPLSALLLTAYLLFVKTHAKRWLLSAVACGVAALLTHFMVLPLLVAVAAHAIRFERKWLLRNAIFTLALVAVAAMACYPYFHFLLHTPSEPSAPGLRPASFFFALSGARAFTAWGLEYFFGWGWFWTGPWLFRGVLALAVAASAYAVLPTFYGIWISARRVRHGGLDMEWHGCWIALVALGAHMALVGVSQLVSHPHYFNAIWFVFFFFFLLGQKSLPGKAWKWAGRVYLVCVAVSFLGGVGLLHYFHGNRQLRYGTTLGNQIELASQLNCYPSGVRVVDERVHSVLGSLHFLRKLYPCEGPPLKALEVGLRYRRPGDIRDGLVVLETLK